jgi:hypothetical protein
MMPKHLPVPIFNLVQAPRLSDTSMAAVTEFKCTYDKYLSILEEHKEVVGKVIIPTPIKSCIDDHILETVCYFVLDNLEVSKVDDEKLKKWIDSIVEIPVQFSLEGLESAVKKGLKMSVEILDINSKILKLFSDHRAILKKHGCIDFLEEYPKLAVNHIVQALKPDVLKKRIEAELSFEKKFLCKDYRKFFTYVVEIARECEKFVFSDSKPQDHSSTFSKGKHQIPNKSHKSNEENSSKFKTPFKGFPKSGCAKCKGRHYMQDCPEASEAEKSSFQKELTQRRVNFAPGTKSYDNGKVPGKLNFGSSSKSSLSPKGAMGKVSSLRPGRILGSVNEVLDIPVLLDSGADETCIGKHHLRKILALGGSVTVKNLEQPFSLSVAFSKGAVAVQESAILNLSFITCAGKMKLRNVPASVIIDDTLDELIIGRYLLEKLGLDPTKHLLDLSKEDLTIDCTDTPSLGNGSISLLLSGDKSYKEENLDPVGPEIDIGVDSTMEIDAAFSLMISKAVEAGFPGESLPKLEELLEEFRDIWRLKLGTDPPVKVPPMKVILKQNAIPVLCKSRRYPPNHRLYMREHVNELVQFGLVFQCE